MPDILSNTLNSQSYKDSLQEYLKKLRGDQPFETAKADENGVNKTQIEYQIAGEVGNRQIELDKEGLNNRPNAFSSVKNAIGSASDSMNKFANSSIGGLISGIGSTALGALQSTDNQGVGVKAANSAVSSITSMISPGGSTLGNIGSSVSGLLGSALGKSTDYTDSASQWMDTGASALSALGPVGSAVGTGLKLVNMLGSTKVEGTANDDQAESELGSSYSFDSYKVGDANIGGLGSLFGGASSQKKKVAKNQTKLNAMSDNADETRNAKASSQNPFLGINYKVMTNGGIGDIYSGKQGFKFNFELNTEKFEQGGQFNVIPDGALHARKNNLTDIHKDLAAVTSKGIPVISSEGGKIVQHAEIEKNEIILTLEVTKKLEELMKKDNDESAIEAGKLLVYEILHNTVDNTGLIKETE